MVLQNVGIQPLHYTAQEPRTLKDRLKISHWNRSP